MLDAAFTKQDSLADLGEVCERAMYQGWYASKVGDEAAAARHYRVAESASHLAFFIAQGASA